MPAAGSQGMHVDLLLASFLMSYGISAVGTSLVARAEARRVEPLAQHGILPRPLAVLPSWTPAPSICLALLAVVAFGLPATIALAASGVQDAPLPRFILPKSLYCGVIAVVVAPLAAVYALGIPVRALAPLNPGGDAERAPLRHLRIVVGGPGTDRRCGTDRRS
jgi:hypothetical protein